MFSGRTGYMWFRILLRQWALKFDPQSQPPKWYTMTSAQMVTIVYLWIFGVDNGGLRLCEEPMINWKQSSTLVHIFPEIWHLVPGAVWRAMFGGWFQMIIYVGKPLKLPIWHTGQEAGLSEGDPKDSWRTTRILQGWVMDKVGFWYNSLGPIALHETPPNHLFPNPNALVGPKGSGLEFRAQTIRIFVHVPASFIDIFDCWS